MQHTSESRKPRLKHWLIYALLALTWGSSFILMKKALRDPEGEAVLAPAQVAGLRLSIAALVLLPASWMAFRKIKRSDLQWIAIVGLIGSGIPAFLFTYSQQFLDSSVAGILNALTPLFTLVVGIAVFRKLVQPRQVMGVFIGLAGAACLIALHVEHTEHLMYGTLILAATLCYGLSVNVVQHKLSHVHPLHITGLSLLMAGIPYGVYVIWSEAVPLALAHPHGTRSLVAVLTLAVAGTAMANMLYFWLTRHVGALFASSVTYIMPLVSVAWGVSDSETLSPVEILLGLLILGGVYLIRQQKA